MKKFVRILALTLTALILTVSLASCFGPAKDPEKAVEALKGDGYTATLDTRVQPALFMIAGFKLDAVVSASKIDTDKDGYYHVVNANVPVFDGVTAIQQVLLVPIAVGDNELQPNDLTRFENSELPDL